MTVLFVALAMSFAISAAASLEAVSRTWWEPRWPERNIAITTTARGRIARIVVGVLLGVTLAIVWQSLSMAVAGAAVGWLAALVVDTDLRSRKIPREPCWLVFAVATTAGFATGSEAGAVSAALAFIIVGVVTFTLAMATKGRLGSGDVRLFLALSAFAWWTGLIGVLLGVALAAVVQVAVRGWFAVRRRPCVALPFGPAIVAGMMIVVLATSGTVSACGDLGGLLSCGSLG